VNLRALTATDRSWIEPFLRERWGALTVVAHGVTYRPAELPGFVAHEADAPVGLVTYSILGEACEIVTIDSVVERRGVGTALVAAVAETARAAGCSRLWLITTNDNLPALRFYQKRGFTLTAVHPGAVTESRKQKPEIPRVGIDGIPIRDELELELEL
jgi:GNAT superfamily N-acetyltransferase